MKDFAGKQHKRKQAHKASPKFKTAKKKHLSNKPQNRLNYHWGNSSICLDCF